MTVHGEDFVILACVVLTVDTIPECDRRTDGRTDGRTEASMMTKTREALHAVARKNSAENITAVFLAGNIN